MTLAERLAQAERERDRYRARCVTLETVARALLAAAQSYSSAMFFALEADKHRSAALQAMLGAIDTEGISDWMRDQ